MKENKLVELSMDFAIKIIIIPDKKVTFVYQKLLLFLFIAKAIAHHQVQVASRSQ